MHLVFYDQYLFEHFHLPYCILQYLPAAIQEQTRVVPVLDAIFPQIDSCQQRPKAVSRRYPEGMPEFVEQQSDPEITPQAFSQLRSAAASTDAPLLLDVREPWEFQTANLPDSLLMPMGDVTSRAHAELDPDAHIVVVCHHGQRSLSVAMWLRGQGFERAQSLAGGIDAWSRVIDPSVPRY
jgi:rhodanese-related sulfurtransferase